SRAWLQVEAGRALGRGDGISWRHLFLGPGRDILSALVFAASFATSVVVWRGRRFRVRRDGTMTELT
ncbi:MAG: hopanoid biosynthesis associated glycosyl transferase HpnI, partial [Pseudomonadota bacterium]|nr:hopanoid biosynthesis associated glycosyl transferase HpnI [Pseudomonadota bacterium]